MLALVHNGMFIVCIVCIVCNVFCKQKTKHASNLKMKIKIKIKKLKQRWIGTWPCVQIYANRVFPPELLAASDAVLEGAGIVTVGIIGYVFMDTSLLTLLFCVRVCVCAYFCLICIFFCAKYCANSQFKKNTRKPSKYTKQRSNTHAQTQAKKKNKKCVIKYV